MTTSFILKTTGATIKEQRMDLPAGKKTIVKGQPSLNFELIDPAIGKGPAKVLVKRIGNRLEIKLGEDGTELVIEEFYPQTGKILGLNEQSVLVDYLPPSGDASWAAVADGASAVLTLEVPVAGATAMSMGTLGLLGAGGLALASGGGSGSGSGGTGENTAADAALAKIEAYNNGDGTTPAALTVADYETAGITGVTAGNLAAVNAAVLGAATGGADTVAEVQALVRPTVTAIALTSATGIQNSSLNAGDVVTATVTFREAVNVTGTPQLALNVGGATVQASYAAGSGTTTLTFNYTIQSGQTDANGISIDANSLTLNGGTLMDSAGNNAIASHAAVSDNAGYLVDTTVPTTGTVPL